MQPDKDFVGETEQPRLIAPFPWFGGKSLIGHEIWEAFGDVEVYVEPFAGSLAVLLARPGHHKRTSEIVNDKDHYIANAWRAIKEAPEAVARYCDWPVNEDDLHARHLWLISAGKRILERVPADPDFYDAKIAGWWLWGIGLWLGHDWCSERGPWRSSDGVLVREVDPGRPGVKRKMPSLGDTGRGVHRPSLRSVFDAQGRLTNPLCHYMLNLADRLRYVRVACGDWSRVLSGAVLSAGAYVGVFLDPPYSAESNTMTDNLYIHDEEVSQAVGQWAIANGDNPRYRIALCGYEGEYQMPDSWTKMTWRGKVGYQGKGGKTSGNPERERVWFSPACLVQPRLI